MVRQSIYCILILAILAGLFTPFVHAQTQPATDEEKTWWDDLLDSKFLYAVVLMFAVSSVVWLIDLFKKDRILKMLLGKYVVILTSGDPRRITGKFRLERGGIEIFSEESRLRGQAPSYIFEASEMGAFEAFIRYHDDMTESERIERDNDYQNTYHPKLMKRIGRTLRNFSHEMRDQFKKTFEAVWGKIRQSTFMQSIQRYESMGGDLTQVQQEAFKYAMDVQYDRLIDRLIGTKVLVEAPGGRYTAVLKEYTGVKGGYMYLLDLRDNHDRGFMETWQVEISIEHGKHAARDDRNAIRARIDGDTMILENHAPYEIEMGWIRFRGGQKDQNHDLKWNWHIEPFGELRFPIRPQPRRQPVGGIEKVFTEQPLTWRNFKKLQMDFRSFRPADVVFPRAKCHIKERAEKYQPAVLDLGGFTDAILNDIKKPEEMVIADKDGKPMQGVHLIHGYVTNINEDRIDIKEVNAAYSKRWSVEHMFETFDHKLRKIAPAKTDLLPSFRHRIVAQTVLAGGVNSKPQLREPIAQPLYAPVWTNGWVRKKQKPILPVKVLALMGNTSRVEYPALQSIERVSGHRVICHQTSDLRLPTIEKTHILWIGYGEIFKDGYRFTIDTEQRVRNFAHKGGVVIVSGQDMRNNKRPTTRWTPELINAVERDESRAFHPAFAGRHLFETPHPIADNQLVFDDAWTEWGPRYEVLATINSGQDAALLRLEYGEGLYILSSLRNASKEDVQSNVPMMENLLYYVIQWLDEQKREHLYIGAVT